MRRRDFIVGLGGAAVAWPLAATAQQGARIRRVGVLMATAADDLESKLRVKAFETGLRDLGLIHGHNITLDYRWAPSNADLLRTTVADLVATTPDVILANSSPVLAALKPETRTIPVVFVVVVDPVGQGFVQSLARPGGNLTGFTNFEFSIGTKWLETLKQIAPAVKRVAVIFNPETALYAQLFWQPIEAAAPSFAITPIQSPARDSAEIERAINTFASERDGGLIVLPDASTTRHRDQIIALSARHQLPAVYPYRFFAASGGLLSYGTDVPDLFRRAAGYVNDILRGTKPSDLPVQAPTKFELAVNLKTTKALGLTVPATLLARADEVIE